MLRSACLLAALAVVAGCDRPLVDPLDVDVQVVSPELDRALVDPTLRLELRVLRGGPAITLRVAGATASFDAARGVYQDTLTLRQGLNVLPVEVLDLGVVAARDTLYALLLDVNRVPTTDLAALPQRAGASTTPLPSGATLVAGGLGTAGPLATTTTLAPTGTATSGTLALGRAGHTASVLPNGEVLLLGGATALDPVSPTQFVDTADLVGPDGTSSGLVVVEGPGFLRAGHTTRVLVSADGRTFLYAYGGRDVSFGAVGTSGTVAIFEWTPDRRLVQLTPPIGAGNFAPAEFHLQLDVPDDRPGPTTSAQAVVLDGAPPDGRAFRFTWRAPGSNYPFSVRLGDVASGLLVPRRAAAAAPTGDLVFVAGGRTPAGELSTDVEVYAPEAGRSFRLPAAVSLSAPREHASAAILAGRRMVVFGGLGRGGAAGGPPDTFLF